MPPKSSPPLSDEESAALPWHRVVAADARISRGSDPELAAKQMELLEAEGITIDPKGFVQDADNHFHVVGIRRENRWSDPL